MNDRPTAIELLDAVSRFLRDDAVPALEGHPKYQARVAANVVDIVARELESEERHLTGEWMRLGEVLDEEEAAPASREALRASVRARNEILVARIRDGDADVGAWRHRVLAHLRQTVSDKLEIARPRRSG